MANMRWGLHEWGLNDGGANAFMPETGQKWVIVYYVN